MFDRERSEQTFRQTRDQRRALYAYNCVQSVPENQKRDYQTAINNLGSTILQSGLSAAIAALKRSRGGGEIIAKHLASANILCLGTCTDHELLEKVNNLDAASYMIVTREVLSTAAWLKRASQALSGDKNDAHSV